MFTIWLIEYFLQIFDISKILSGILGAKQLVVLRTQTILSGPTFSIYYSSKFKSVVTASSSIFVSTTIGIKLAVYMHLRQVF